MKKIFTHMIRSKWHAALFMSFMLAMFMISPAESEDANPTHVVIIGPPGTMADLEIPACCVQVEVDDVKLETDPDDLSIIGLSRDEAEDILLEIEDALALTVYMCPLDESVSLFIETYSTAIAIPNFISFKRKALISPAINY